MNKLYEETSIQDIANAIREKNGLTDTYTVSEMGNAIREIQSGGGDIDALIDGSLTEIESNVTSVRDYAFYRSNNLKSVELPNVTSIGNFAFSYAKLASANIPNATTLGSAIFQFCSNLTTVNMPKITSITPSMFQSTEIANANFPLVTSIGDSAFNSCDKLTNVNFPLVESIGGSAFYYCIKITTVDFPLVTSIKNGAFNSCRNLTIANFSKATSVGTTAFSGCSNLNQLIIGTEQTTVCTLSNANALANTPIASGTGYIYVPDDLVDSYKTATNWATYANQIKGISELPT